MINNKQSIQWVDALKTLGILAVILGHIASPMGQFIFSWHMPLFFVISGFFIKFNLPFNEFFMPLQKNEWALSGSGSFPIV
jgi:fucose 4-O-acetylase-like acetyltransferase